MRRRPSTREFREGLPEKKLELPKRVQPVAREIVGGADGETLIIDVTIQTDLGRGFSVGALIAVDWVCREGR